MTGTLLAAAGAVLAEPVLAGEAPAPDQWSRRIPLTLAVLGTAALLCWLMWRSYSRRMRRQERSLDALPAVPDDLGAPVLAPASGYWVGTTAAGAWLERVAALGLTERGDATLALHDAGLLVTRGAVDRAPERLFVPVSALRGARSDRALAGKVVADGGMLVVTWALGGSELDTGLVVGNRRVQAAYVRALNEAVGRAARARPGPPGGGPPSLDPGPHPHPAPDPGPPADPQPADPQPADPQPADPQPADPQPADPQPAPAARPSREEPA